MTPYTISDESKEKAKAAMRDMALRGELPGCAPVGYRNVTENYRKKVVIDEPAARLVRLAFGIAATEERPLRDILKEMTTYGLVSRNGKPVGVSSFWGMLTNPFYVGSVRYVGEVVPGAHEPLIDKRLFDIVQTRLGSRNRSHRTKTAKR